MNTDSGPEATYLTAWGLLTSRAVQHCGAGEITCIQVSSAVRCVRPEQVHGEEGYRGDGEG